MKRIFGLALFTLAAVGMFGCPVYGGSGGGGNCWSNDCSPYPNAQCQTNNDCPNGFYCGGNGYCVGELDATTTNDAGSCSSPSDCPTGQNCSQTNQCVPGTCASSGCPLGYVCLSAGGSVQCVLATDGATPVDGATDATLDTGSPTDGGVESSTADAPADTTPPFTGCTSDQACASLGAGAKCLDGVCYSAANECSDSTQCPAGTTPNSTEQCVEGVCTPSCSATVACPTGFSCDTTNQVCTGNTTPCGAADGGTACGAGLTCVQEHCVAPCGPADGGEGGTCGTGLVCVDGGCIPNQQPNFICGTDGQEGTGQSGSCATGSVCLHHNCYISCNPDAGTAACQNAEQFNVCKPVSTSTGTYNVCGSSTNLGNQCDPTQGINCPNAGICIDGYCR